MRIVGVIPARYESSRFPGKPLADICGKPMIWWVYQQVKKVNELDEVYVATDDDRIKKTCDELDIKAIMTSANCKTSTERAYEVAQIVSAELYVVVNGDEPLIDPKVIARIIPDHKPHEMYVGNLMTRIEKASEVIDFTNIKVVVDEENNAVFFSRSPIPYPKASLEYEYYKHVGVLIYDYKALRFFSESEPGRNEKIEDVNELRFIDHGVKIKMTEVITHCLSVDTPKDLEVVRKRLAEICINTDNME